MTVTSSTIFLLDCLTGEPVEAQLIDAIEEAQLIDWQTRWLPALKVVLQELAKRGVPVHQWPQSWHWDWKEKMARVQGLLAHRGFCIVAQGETQGLAQIDLTKSAREASQARKPLIYVSYLEVAPWNRPELGQPRRLGGVGFALLSATVQLSLDEGFKGRIGLHSLPQADDFYRQRCAMVDLGPDPECQNLRYFEMTAEQARAFLKEEDEHETRSEQGMVDRPGTPRR